MSLLPLIAKTDPTRCRATRVGPWNMLARPFKGATGIPLFFFARVLQGRAQRLLASLCRKYSTKGGETFSGIYGWKACWIHCSFHLLRIFDRSFFNQYRERWLSIVPNLFQKSISYYYRIINSLKDGKNCNG